MNELVCDEIVSGEVSGGATTSHTIVVEALTTVLAVVPADASFDEYAAAVTEENVLGKATQGARKRTFRYLCELYVLRRDSALFRALRDLWSDDIEAQPLLAGLCAIARDPLFRATAPTILDFMVGDEVTPGALEEAVEAQFPGNYNDGTRAKIGRNTASSWEQTGHLESHGRTPKCRQRAICRPSNLAYALMLGHLQGLRGEMLFDSLWVRLLDQPRGNLFDVATTASQRGLIEFRRSGGVTEVGFRELLRPVEGRLL